MRIGIFGGVFDPIHVGHLIAAEEIREQLKLNKVLFIPSYNPPHKKTPTSYLRRRNMVELAIQNNPYFKLCEIEKEIGGKSWTIETLKILHKLYPKDQCYLIIGADQYQKLNDWKEPESLTRYAQLVVMNRPHSKIKNQKSKIKIIRISISQIDVASKDIRERIKQGKSIRYKVAEDVCVYIYKNKVYK
jgi:nicotinate-nucleotide adenylyltransferase